jgi:hypothetical protein
MMLHSAHTPNVPPSSLSPWLQVWIITPEFAPSSRKPPITIEQHFEEMRQMLAQMQPKVLMYMVHNGHMAEDTWNLVRGVVGVVRGAAGAMSKGRGPAQNADLM